MNNKKEPLFHIVKKDAIPWQKALLIRVLAIVAALLVCAVLTTVLTGDNPLQVYGTMFTGAFGTARKTWVTFQNTAILLIISIALTPAFKMRFWNIGGEGQVLMGALAAALCMILMGDKYEQGFLVLCMTVSSMAAGALWALIPAVCKAVWNTNETLSTLMMNYIATQLVAYFVVLFEVPKGAGKIGIINQNTEAGWFQKIGNTAASPYIMSIVVALSIAGLMYIYLSFSKHGYEISVVGESQATAKYVGINVSKVIIRTMCISGALCGVAGLLLVGGINHTITTTIAGGQGFTAVMVSWLAHFNPLFMILASLLIIFMSRGAGEISSKFGLNHSFSDILTGIILFFIIGCEFFITYKIEFRKKEKQGSTSASAEVVMNEVKSADNEELNTAEKEDK